MPSRYWVISYQCRSYRGSVGLFYADLSQKTGQYSLRVEIFHQKGHYFVKCYWKILVQSICFHWWHWQLKNLTSQGFGRFQIQCIHIPMFRCLVRFDWQLGLWPIRDLYFKVCHSSFRSPANISTPLMKLGKLSKCVYHFCGYDDRGF